MDTRYAKVGDAHIAYRAFGEGPTDILVFMSEYIPIDAVDEEPRSARAIRRLASLGRVLVFNRRGVGLSDAPDGEITQEQTVEDALAVAEHAGADKVVVFGSSVGGPAAMLFAADHPERTAAAVFVNAVARYASADDYPHGIPVESFDETASLATSVEPTEFDFLTTFLPSVANDDRFRKWWDAAGHRGASPARSRAFWNLLGRTDVREALPRINAPSLVVARDGLFLSPLYRYVADRIPGARYVEVPGADLIWWVGDSDRIVDEVETFLLTQGGSERRARRRLATVLFVDVVGSTERAVAMGDRRWRDLLATYHDIAQRQLTRWEGTQVGTAGDGIVATFEMPADAVRCAKAIADDVRAVDVIVRAGVHTGEIEVLDDDVAGIGVHIAARVMATAHPGEVLVSRTVADLVTGSGLAFEHRGEHELKGVPGTWTLYALA